MMKMTIDEAVDGYLSRNGFGSFDPKAALIDMDGTLLDSMKGHTLAWQRMVSEIGIPCTRDGFYLYEGMTGAETINMLFKRRRLLMRKPNFMPGKLVILTNCPVSGL